MNRKKIIIVLAASVAVSALCLVWQRWFAATEVAFVNWQVSDLGQISKANDNGFVKIRELPVSRLSEAGRYDMVFVNGMGIRITAEQREGLRRAAEKGLPVLVTAATNPDNNIVSLDSADNAAIRQYIAGGGRANYRNMLSYVRRHVDGKVFKAPEPQAAVERTYYMLYHPDPSDPGNEDRGFNSVAEYEAFLKASGLYDADAPGVILTGQMGEPSDLIRRLEETGNMVYPVRFAATFFRRGHADSVDVAAVINMAHGRMGDYIVDYLTEKNVPLFAPLNVNSLVEDWENDPMGMNGGFMSQSIVTPEIDGAIRPFVLFGNYVSREDGLQYLHAIPERLEHFVTAVNNHISLRHKPNREKRVAIYYFKGPGQSALTAGGMEVVPSLYNLLVRLRAEGYDVSGLPDSAEELGNMIQERGAVFGAYAEGAMSAFIRTAEPEIITPEEYAGWVSESLGDDMYAEAVAVNGEFPGSYMSTPEGNLALARLRFGNVVLLPQLAAGMGDNDFEIVHGTDAAPPHAYIASYLWTQYGFKADALIHFGAHGSLEFTPRKQVALSRKDWSDRLVGDLPHFYVYTIANVGEAMMAKRRAYAGLHSYLTPPFMESGVRTAYSGLTDRLKEYNRLAGADVRDEAALQRASLAVKKAVLELGIHRELGLDTVPGKAYSEAEVARVENFAEELVNEKVTGALYVMGEPYADKDIRSTVMAMSTDPVAYGLYAIDKAKGRAEAGMEKHRAEFSRRYLAPAKRLVAGLLDGKTVPGDDYVCRVAGITADELVKAREISAAIARGNDIFSIMTGMAEEMPAAAVLAGTAISGTDDGNADVASLPSGHPGGKFMKELMKKMGKGMDREKMMAMARSMSSDTAALARMEKAMSGRTKAVDNAGSKASSGMSAMMESMSGGMTRYSDEEKAFASAVMEVERALKNVVAYRDALKSSPENELRSIINGLDGGYVVPSPGGDPVANPNTLPTGRNLYAINAEATPSEEAWEKGKLLADNTISLYRQRHNDSIPRKVSYTLWSSEFIETEGATIAQILYMLGVEPVRDAFGRVTDLRLIPSAELGRPRIDVVVQTSGQLRDLAASRLFLISRAVEMAAAAKDDVYDNQVASGVLETEKLLIDKGMTPKDAREVSLYRVFGGVNGNYGTGIQGMVQAGDRWEDESEIAEVYLNNMGAYYGSEDKWEEVRQFAFEAALDRTDAVVQPRQSNTWGALSLDHVYEFMGGMNLAVRNVTGKDPDAYLSDYRNRNNVRMQEVKEAIGVESRTTIFNPEYIREKMKGGAGDAAALAEVVQNTYGWNVMKPQAVDDEMWDRIYDVYVKDSYGLGVQEFFEKNSPAALQEMTAVMMESARKGLWNASEAQLADIAALHAGLVEKYRPACSGTVCDNDRLRDFIASKTDGRTAARYTDNIRQVREAAAAGDGKGMVMKKERLDSGTSSRTNVLNNTIIALVAVAAVVFIVVFVRKRRRSGENDE